MPVATARRSGVAVDAAGQHWMGEPNAVAINENDAGDFRPFKQPDDLLYSLAGHAGQQVDSRVRHARGRRQRVEGTLVQALDPQLHQPRKRARKHLLAAVGIGVHFAGQLQRVKRVTAGYLRYPCHGRARKRMTQPVLDQGMESP